MPSEYVKVFEITQSAPDWPFALVGLFPIAIAIGIYVRKRRLGWKQPGWLFTNLTFLFGLFFFCVIGGALLLHEPEYLQRLKTGNYRVVERVVTDFSPMPYEGHKDECFSVQGVWFCYSDYSAGPGFHQSASHGGPIREGLPVRIAYSEGAILRLEVPRDAVLTPAQAAAVADANEKQYQAMEAADPFEQEMQVAFLIVGIGWILWWNLQWKRVMQFWVRRPNRPIVQYGFRIFFALSLVGAVSTLIGQLRAHPLSRDQLIPTSQIAAIMGVAVALMSVFGIWMIERRNRQNQDRTALPQ